MEENKILYVSSEVMPYFSESPQSKLSIEAAKQMNSSGNQVRIFMPRFGTINERRHQLHEVIRLSGVNLIINDIDRPLIIKVASIPRERLQVYFIDNDEYFKRKNIYYDDKNVFFEDNDERMIFYAKGVLETVKKLNWTPDVIHIHGWMSGLIPIYIKTHYKSDPVFSNSKIVTSIYDKGFKGSLNGSMIDKLLFDDIQNQEIEILENPTYKNLTKIMVNYSDAIVKGSESLPEYVNEIIEESNLPVLPFTSVANLSDVYNNFYNSLVLNEV